MCVCARVCVVFSWRGVLLYARFQECALVVSPSGDFYIFFKLRNMSCSCVRLTVAEGICARTLGISL